MSKEINLSRGLVAIVDDDLFDYLNQWKWYAYPHRGTFYARRNRGVTEAGKPQEIMHVRIMQPREGNQVDHINGNGLDNRRENLRECTHTENMRNRKIHRNNTSGYKGVYKKKQGWFSAISVNGEFKYLGCYTEKEDAAKAYDVAAKDFYGEFAKTNF